VTNRKPTAAAAFAAAVLLAGCSRGGHAAEPPPAPSASPSPSPSASPSLDPIQQRCQADEDLLAGFLQRYADASADLNASKQKRSNFLKFASRLTGLISDVKAADVSRGFEGDRKDLLDGLTKVKDGTLKALNATSTDTYKAGTKLVDQGHKEVTAVDDRLSADYFNCTTAS
jgi:hypothetical protein